jgi:hypothetical protein
MEMPAQHAHDGIVFKAFERLHALTVAHDGQAKAGAGGFSVHGNGAGTTGPVFTSQMGCREATSFAQEIGERFSRLHLVRDFATIELKGQGLHFACTSRTARRTVETCKRIK